MGTTVWNGMLGLLLPRGCAGCDMPDEVLCPECRALFRKHVTLPLGGAQPGRATGSCARTSAGRGAAPSTATSTTTQPVAITAGGAYQGRVRRAILSWKDHGDTECDRAFAQICRELAREAVAGGTAKLGMASNGATCIVAPAPILVIPAPSSPQSMRARGRRHLWPLAKAIASELAYGGAQSCAVNALGISRVHGKAVETNNASGRAARLKERLEVADPGLIAGKSVLILDDIVTTGTTMRRCAEAIRGAGGQVIGGIALAAVPPPDEL